MFFISEFHSNWFVKFAFCVIIFIFHKFFSVLFNISKEIAFWLMIEVFIFLEIRYEEPLCVCHPCIRLFHVQHRLSQHCQLRYLKTRSLSFCGFVWHKVEQNIIWYHHNIHVCGNISSYSFNDTDLSLGIHLHIGLKLCILTGNSEILIKGDLLTLIKILASVS